MNAQLSFSTLNFIIDNGGIIPDMQRKKHCNNIDGLGECSLHFNGENRN